MFLVFFLFVFFLLCYYFHFCFVVVIPCSAFRFARQRARLSRAHARPFDDSRTPAHRLLLGTRTAHRILKCLFVFWLWCWFWLWCRGLACTSGLHGATRTRRRSASHGRLHATGAPPHRLSCNGRHITCFISDGLFLLRFASALLLLCFCFCSRTSWPTTRARCALSVRPFSRPN